MNQDTAGIMQLTCWKHTMRFHQACAVHTHPYSEFYLCLEGLGEQVTPSGRFLMKPGDLFYFAPGEAHIGNGHPANPGQVGTGIVLYLAKSVFSPTSAEDQESLAILQLIRELVRESHYRVPLSPESTEAMLQLLPRVAEEMRLACIGHRCAAKSLVQQALATIARDPMIPAALADRCFRPNARPRLANVCQYIEAHYSDPLTLEQLIAMTPFAHSQFHAVFKRETGCTCVEYLTRIRLRHAAKLLETSGLPILDIAYQCGFPCISHFYAVFRSHYGTTPRAMREGFARLHSAVA